jgi:hypothetical protein
MRYWKKVVAGGAAMLISVGAAHGEEAPSAVEPADRSMASARQETTRSLLEERVEELEKRLDRLTARPPSPAPKAAERQREKREPERWTEFPNPVWTGP